MARAFWRLEERDEALFTLEKTSVPSPRGWDGQRPVCPPEGVRSHRCALGSLICSDSRMPSPAYTVPSIGVFFLRRVRALAGILLPEEGWSGCCCLLSAKPGPQLGCLLAK